MNAARSYASPPIGTRIFAHALLALGLALALAAPTPALADAGSDSPPAGAALDAQHEHLWQLRTIMHNAAFVAEPTAEGVRVTVTAPEAGLEAAIRAQFDASLQSPVADSTVSATEVAGGVELAFSSDDPAVVTQLQAYGEGMAYSLLRNEMHATMLSLSAAGGWGPGTMGPGMMGSGAGWGHMGGWNQDAQGNGPGAGQQGPGYGRGRMGDGSGHMGGGYGRMHGWFWNQQVQENRTTE